jgi:hypothetical protein
MGWAGIAARRWCLLARKQVPCGNKRRKNKDCQILWVLRCVQDDKSLVDEGKQILFGNDRQEKQEQTKTEEPG